MTDEVPQRLALNFGYNFLLFQLTDSVLCRPPPTFYLNAKEQMVLIIRIQWTHIGCASLHTGTSVLGGYDDVHVLANVETRVQTWRATTSS